MLVAPPLGCNVMFASVLQYANGVSAFAAGRPSPFVVPAKAIMPLGELAIMPINRQTTKMRHKAQSSVIVAYPIWSH